MIHTLIQESGVIDLCYESSDVIHAFSVIYRDIGDFVKVRL